MPSVEVAIGLSGTNLFARIEVLGPREATVHLTAYAVRHGLAAMLPAVIGIPVSGRGERRQASTTDLNVPVSLPLEITLTGAEPWIGSATS